MSLKSRRLNFAILFACPLLILAATAGRARATLGGTSASIARDASRMHATIVQPAASGAVQRSPARAPGFTVARLKTPANVSVREYVAPGGTVFAVSWRGPAPPSLATLLGAYFTQYRKAAAASSPTTFGLHNSIVVAPDVTVETGGHMGDLWGRAWVPTMMPPGVGESEIE